MIDDNGPGAVTLGVNDRALAVAAVKAVLRVAASDEDALIAAFAETALGLCEQFLGRMTIARALRETLPAGGGWQRLGAAPVRAISGVEAPPGTALAAAAFALDIDANGDGWVRVLDGAGRSSVGASSGVIAKFEAGIAADWASLPGPLRQGVVLLAAFLFDQRDTSTAPPAAITALWRPFRRIALGRELAPC